MQKTGCAGCALHSPLICSEHQQSQGRVHHPSLETEMSQLIGFRRKLLCPTEQGALIPLIQELPNQNSKSRSSLCKTLIVDYLCDCASALNSPYALPKHQPVVAAFHCGASPLASVGLSLMSKRAGGDQPHLLEMGHQT